jgi:predicted transcriptional regulator
MNLKDRPDVSPGQLHDTVENALNGLKVFNLLNISIELDIFDFLNKQMTYKQISEKLGIEPVLTYYLLEALVKLGLIEKLGEFYKNTRASQLYLNSESDYNQSNCMLFLKGKADSWNNLEHALKGDLYQKDENSYPFLIQAVAEDCLSGELQETIELVANYNEFKRSKTLLDVGGGHGLYSIAFNQVNPDLQCYVFDFPEVLKETQKFIEKYNSSVSTIPGNFYTDDFVGNYDIIFSSYNPGGKNPEIAKKVYNSLNLNGLFLNKQYFPEDEKDTLEANLDSLEWNFTNFEKTSNSKERFSFKGDLSFEDYITFLENLGFNIIDIHYIDHFNSPFGPKAVNKLIVAKKVR